MEQRILLLILSASLTFGARSQGTCPASVTDIDGNEYPVVRIGDRCWTAKNLATAHYDNGDSIPTGLSDADWEFTAAGACTVYAFDPANEATYGKLYNWFAVTEARGLCPTGWHPSTDADWLAMELHLGMDPAELALWDLRGELPNVGGQLKSTTGWAAPNTGATNSSGFSALPGGYAGYDQTFEFLTVWGNYWTASDNAGSGIGRRLTYTDQGIYRSYHINQAAFSCRCVYDQLVGVEEEEVTPTLEVYPNPTTGMVQVKLRQGSSTYTVCDALGRTVHHGQFLTGLNTLDLSAFPPGLYRILLDGVASGPRVIKQ